jgi:hypothetical protein
MFERRLWLANIQFADRALIKCIKEQVLKRRGVTRHRAGKQILARRSLKFQPAFRRCAGAPNPLLFYIFNSFT